MDSLKSMILSPLICFLKRNLKRNKLYTKRNIACKVKNMLKKVFKWRQIRKKVSKKGVKLMEVLRIYPKQEESKFQDK